MECIPHRRRIQLGIIRSNEAFHVSWWQKAREVLAMEPRRTSPSMGRFTVQVELTNFKDLLNAENGQIAFSDVRRVRIPGLVDTGATRLVIPEKIVNQLGLEIKGAAKVRYADGRTEERPIAWN